MDTRTKTQRKAENRAAWQAAPRWQRILVTTVALAAVGGLVGYGMAHPQPGTTGNSSTVLFDEAFEACKPAVNAQLVSPGTASYPDYFTHPEQVSIVNVGDTYSVASHVDSENAFGGVLRTSFACTVSTSDGGSTWTGASATLVPSGG